MPSASAAADGGGGWLPSSWPCAAAAAGAAVALPTMLASYALTPTKPSRVLATRADLCGTGSRLFLFVAGHGYAVSSSQQQQQQQQNDLPPLPSLSEEVGAAEGVVRPRLHVEVTNFVISKAERDEFVQLACGSIAKAKPLIVDPASAMLHLGLRAAVVHLFPHCMAQPLMLELIVSAGFPLRAMGALHVRSTFRVHDEPALATILMGSPNGPAPLRMTGSYVGARATASGIETLLLLCAYDAKQPSKLLWSEVVTILKAEKLRNDAAVAAAAKRFATHVIDPAVERRLIPSGARQLASIPAVSSSDKAGGGVAAVVATADQTWAFGCLTGDVNPIHMSTLGAKAFGQASRIAHGALVVAKAIVDRNAASSMPAEWSLQFKGPVPCGAPVVRVDATNGFDLLVAKKKPSTAEGGDATYEVARPGKSNICVRFGPIVGGAGAKL